MSEIKKPLTMRDGAPARPEPIPPAWHVSADTRQRISEILDHGCFSDWYGGPVCREFEKEFAFVIGAADAVAVNSGTSALHVAVVAGGVEPGDEVIMPVAAYVSAASVVAQERAIPVLCDIDEVTFTIDTADLERRVTGRTRAIIVVHFWGCPVNMTVVSEIASRHGLVVIEDCGQSHGATFGSNMTGSIGDLGAFSFAPRKHITTGQGGMVTCRTRSTAARVRALVNKGKGYGWLDYYSLGYGYGMSELDAAIGLDGLKALGDSVCRRRKAREIYQRVLEDTPLILPDDPPWGRHAYFKVPILLPDDATEVRDTLVEAISAENVSCRPSHPPMYSIPWLAEYVAGMGHPYDLGSYPAARRLLPRLLEVESGPNMSDEDVEVSAQAVLKAWHSSG